MGLASCRTCAVRRSAREMQREMKCRLQALNGILPSIPVEKNHAIVHSAFIGLLDIQRRLVTGEIFFCDSLVFLTHTLSRTGQVDLT
jgi:hypothetical protein